MAKIIQAPRATRILTTCRRNLWVWLGLISLLVVVPASCGSRKDSVAETASEPTRIFQATPLPTATRGSVGETGLETQPEPMEESELTLVFWSDPDRAPVVAELGQAFAETYGAEVRVEAKELATIRDDLLAALSQQQNMPDIFIGGQDWIPLLAANNIVVPMDLEAFSEEYAPSVLAAMSYEGHYYGVPLAADSLALVYNPDLIPNPPDTWQELQYLAAQQVDTGVVDIGLAVNALSPFDIYPVLTGFSGGLFRYHPHSGFDLSSIEIDSAATQQAVAWLLDMEDQGLTDFERSWHEVHLLFGSGQVPMMITGPWSLSLLDEGNAAYDIAAFPEGGRSFVNVQAYMINAYSKDPFLSWLFLAHMVMTADSMLRLYEANPSSPPAFLPIVSQIGDHRHQAFAHLTSQGTAIPNILEMDEIWRIWGQAQYAIFSEGADPADALGGAQNAMSAVLETRLSEQK